MMLLIASEILFSCKFAGYCFDTLTTWWFASWFENVFLGFTVFLNCWRLLVVLQFDTDFVMFQLSYVGLECFVIWGLLCFGMAGQFEIFSESYCFGCNLQGFGCLNLVMQVWCCLGLVMQVFVVWTGLVLYYKFWMNVFCWQFEIEIPAADTQCHSECYDAVSDFL